MGPLSILNSVVVQHLTKQKGIMPRKNGKSKAPRVADGSRSMGHSDHESTDDLRSSPSDFVVSPKRQRHLSGENLDTTNDHHSLEECERVEEDDLLQEQGIFELAYGYIYFSKGKSAKPTPLLDDNSFSNPDAAEPSKGGSNPSFRFVGRNCQNAILLFGNQMFKLVRELRNAYKAYQRSDESYQFVVVENKTHRVTLEVSLYQDKTYLFLKRYFQNRDGPDPDTWLPTKGVVSLNPNQDDPAKMLRYVLKCCH